jgi:hypothetical protein
MPALSTVMGEVCQANDTEFHVRIKQSSEKIAEEAKQNREALSQLRAVEENQPSVHAVVNDVVGVIESTTNLGQKVAHVEKDIKNAHNELQNAQTRLAEMQGALLEANKSALEDLMTQLEEEQEKARRTCERLLESKGTATLTAQDLQEGAAQIDLVNRSREDAIRIQVRLSHVKTELTNFVAKTKVWCGKVSEKLQSYCSIAVKEAPLVQIPLIVHVRMREAQKKLNEQLDAIKASQIVLSAKEQEVLAIMKRMTDNLVSLQQSLEKQCLLMEAQATLVSDIADRMTAV